MILVLLLYAAFGLSFSIGKILVDYAQPLFAVGARMTLGGILLLGYMRFYKGERIIIYRENISYYIQAILFNVFFPYTLRLWAFDRGLATIKSSLLFNLAPFLTALFAFFFIGERLSRTQAISLIIGFLGGMIPILATQSAQETGGFAITNMISSAEVAMLGAVASIAYSLILSQKLVKQKGSPAYLITGISMFFGGLLSFACSFLFETSTIFEVTQPVIKGDGLKLTYVLIFQILLSNVLCQNLRVELLKRYSSTFMSFAGLLGPIFTSFYGMTLFGEEVQLNYILSFIIVVFGLTLYHYDNTIQQTPERNFTDGGE